MGTYRDDLEAAQARADALERENEELREAKATLEARIAAPPPPKRRRIPKPEAPADTSERPGWPLWRKIGLVLGIACAIGTVILGLLGMDLPEDENPYGIWMFATAGGGTLGFWLAAGAPEGSG